MTPLFVSVPEAARILGISKTHAYTMVRQGEIPVKRFGCRQVVPVVALERMAEEAAAA